MPGVKQPVEKQSDDAIDVVYILKADAGAEELRYSLRSLENLPHGRVWFFCGCPNGLEPDEHVPFVQTGISKWEKATSTYRAIAQTEGVTDDFWMFNDDFFVMEPVQNIPYMFYGTLADKVAGIRARTGFSHYADRLDRTRLELERRGMSSLNYALHVPMRFNKAKVLEVLNEFPRCPMFRSLYGNYCRVDGIEAEDVKIRDMGAGLKEGQTLVSTGDASFMNGRIGDIIRNTFTNKSRWEK